MPDFPWDRLRPAKEQAAAHPDGVVDLSVGTPVDPVPEPVRAALCAAADSPGYPTVAGTARLREAITEWVATRCGVSPEQLAVLPTIGSKELVAALPAQLGLGPGDTVVVPSISYPTYEVGALLAGASVVRSDSLTAVGPSSRTRLVWVNSPANPTGRVLPMAHLRKLVAWARERGAVLASDECYLTLGWEGDPISVLAACDGRYDRVLSVHSLSKRSNLAGYRAGFIAGDPELVGQLWEVRKHSGAIVPAPVQAAMVAALADEQHARAQRERYATRRALLRPALVKAGFTVEHSEAGLYLWITRQEPCWQTVAWFAERGILVSPGEFYGPGGDHHVRVALTASDERVAAAVSRLTG
ncbi:succinyldiaminopimelate transaminase [Natronosporangium hydrolyticum]|uniref:Aminotransferase n=1 Tax=Natronosporangium hydrolyticum TaxID=2811111 RepID=A0A895YNP8_9ACTN|nr:succinyldiaminopimelate transaminase [Natronosporangium hydrolyticum]